MSFLIKIDSSNSTITLHTSSPKAHNPWGLGIDNWKQTQTEKSGDPSSDNFQLQFTTHKSDFDYCIHVS